MDHSSHHEHSHNEATKNKSEDEDFNPLAKIPKNIKDELSKYYSDVILESIPDSKRERKIAFSFIPRYENNILAFVYIGAAFLVLVLGLRGMGSSVPDFMQDISTHRLKNWVVFVALGAEFLMILFLGITMLFKVEDFGSLFKNFINIEEKHKGEIKEVNTLAEIGTAIDKIKHDYDDLIDKFGRLR